jgi:NAD(P)-dependent dehydrogenase (short-subunit alcohol dehydrogenase family)
MLKDDKDSSKKVAVITGGSGFLGEQHCIALLEKNMTVYNFDLSPCGSSLLNEFKSSNNFYDIKCDITDENSVKSSFKKVIDDQGKVDILVNNASIDYKVLPNLKKNQMDFRFENIDLYSWQNELAVGLTGAIYCCKYAAKNMIENRSGIIVNISSDLGVVAPDQRIYLKDNAEVDDVRFYKPFSYSVIKHGLIGLTKYLATYLAEFGIRVNTLSPGSIFNYQDPEFLIKLKNNIPMNRLAKVDEYKGAVQFLTSDSSSYMTGHNLIIDGGRSVW